MYPPRYLSSLREIATIESDDYQEQVSINNRSSPFLFVFFPMCYTFLLDIAFCQLPHRAVTEMQTSYVIDEITFVPSFTGLTFSLAYTYSN